MNIYLFLSPSTCYIFLFYVSLICQWWDHTWMPGECVIPAVAQLLWASPLCRPSRPCPHPANTSHLVAAFEYLWNPQWKLAGLFLQCCLFPAETSRLQSCEVLSACLTKEKTVVFLAFAEMRTQDAWGVFWLLGLLPSSHFSVLYIFFLLCGILGNRTQVVHPGGLVNEGGAGVGLELIRARWVGTTTMPLRGERAHERRAFTPSKVYWDWKSGGESLH